MLRIILTSALCSPVFALMAQTTAPTQPIAVVVLDTLRTPVSNANVSVVGAQRSPIRGVTDERGHFVARVEFAGDYDVNVRRVGFAPSSAHVRVTGRDPVTTVTVVLSPLAVRIDPVVVNDTRLPLDKRPFIDSAEIASSRRGLFSLNDVMRKLRAHIDYQAKQRCLGFPHMGPIQDGVIPQSAIPKSRLRAWIYVNGIRIPFEENPWDNIRAEHIQSAEYVNCFDHSKPGLPVLPWPALYVTLKPGIAFSTRYGTYQVRDSTAPQR